MLELVFSEPETPALFLRVALYPRPAGIFGSRSSCGQIVVEGQPKGPISGYQSENTNRYRNELHKLPAASGISVNCHRHAPSARAPASRSCPFRVVPTVRDHGLCPATASEVPAQRPATGSAR